MVSYARQILRGTLLVSAASPVGIGVAVAMYPDSGMARTLKFWRGVMPVFLHYKLVERRLASLPNSDLVSAEYYEPLNDRYAPKIETLTLDLQGFYYKLAQTVSTRDEFLPDQYMRWAKRLQHNSPRTMPLKDVRDTVETEIGRPIADVFDSFDDEPIGAASIGQVHRATLRETGEEVVVKVQFPGIEEKFRSDIGTVEKFCTYFMPQNAPYFREIKKQFQTEFDYLGEAHNLAIVHGNLSSSKWRSLVAVPRPIPELCSKRVLVMTYLPGERMVDGIRNQYRRMAEAQGKDFGEMEAEQKELLASGAIERKNVGKSARVMAGMTWALWARDAAVNSALWLGNWTVVPLLRLERWEYWHTEAPLNLGAMLETLLRVHAHEIFFDGAFNADCHPGNVLLMPDGRLGLIDYGQFKRMSISDRIIYAKLVLALYRDDRDEVVRLMTDEIGFKTKHMNKDVIWRTCAFWNDRDTDDVTMGMNVHKFLEYLEATDPPVEVNDEFIMVGRVSILLRGMANAFALKLRVSEYWRHEAEEFLKSQGVEI